MVGRDKRSSAGVIGATTRTRPNSHSSRRPRSCRRALRRLRSTVEKTLGKEVVKELAYVGTHDFGVRIVRGANGLDDLLKVHRSVAEAPHRHADAIERVVAAVLGVQEHDVAVGLLRYHPLAVAKATIAVVARQGSSALGLRLLSHRPARISPASHRGSATIWRSMRNRANQRPAAASPRSAGSSVNSPAVTSPRCTLAHQRA